ncbi:hypothetical protein [Streptomyces naganishii]|uniref:Uncharacterized protein n=1 Tax=Streptomyces naganishii JCM 4654 TaxID=1306179 RepID=A0A918YAC4_9ACTN|nr:hypothetical protein [Streptomyces naganishii]GHD96719.1 hypothetical protein GCM10010508_66530 [Streptomyces naganishii JCM 4654]
MIQQVVHEKAETADATLPRSVALALAVAKELHTPESAPAARADLPVPEVPAPQLMGLRTSPARIHRHKVPLGRLTAMAV